MSSNSSYRGLSPLPSSRSAEWPHSPNLPTPPNLPSPPLVRISALCVPIVEGHSFVNSNCPSARGKVMIFEHRSGSHANKGNLIYFDINFRWEHKIYGRVRNLRGNNSWLVWGCWNRIIILFTVMHYKTFVLHHSKYWYGLTCIPAYCI